MVTQYKASHRYAKTTARKARLVADLIRGLPVNRALAVLDRSPRRAAVLVGKVVRSAVANAEQDTAIDPNHLTVSLARVDEGPLLGGFLRWRAGSRGRSMPIHKRTAHIHVALSPSVAVAPRTGRGKAAAVDAAAGDAASAGDVSTTAAPAAGTRRKGGSKGAAAKGGKSTGGASPAPAKKKKES